MGARGLIFAAVAVCALAVGCGGGTSGGAKNGGSTNVPTADGGAPSCTPATCESASATCGTLTDGCGGTLSCGTCGSGQTCGGGGEANTCGAGTCTPKTCAELSAQCGQVSDGCGDVLTCGGCGAGETCGASAPNQCALPPPAFGTVDWVRLGTSGQFSAVGASPLGTRVYTAGPVPQTNNVTGSSVSAFDGNDASLWTKTENAYVIMQLFMSPDGASLFSYGYDGHPSPPAQYLYAYDDELNGQRLVGSGSDNEGLQPAGTNGGEAASLLIYSAWSQLSVGPNSPWTYNPPANLDIWRVAMDANGNTYGAAITDGPVQLGGSTFGNSDGRRGLLVLKFDPKGTLVWAHEMIPDGGNATPDAIAVSSAGTVVVMGEFTGVAHWAGGTYDSATGETFLLTLEAAGTSRWFLQAKEAGPITLVLDPSRNIFLIAPATECTGGIHVDAYDLAGDTFPGKSLGCGGDLTIHAASALGHDLVIAGGYQGANDFGNGTTTSQGAAGDFLLRMSGP